MEIHITNVSSHGLKYRTKRLLAMASSPLCGITQNITFLARSRQSARLMSVSGDLANIQYLDESLQTFSMSYHIGSSGVYLDEVLIRLLSESVERYSLATAGICKIREYVFASYNKMMSNRKPVIKPENLTFFSEEQLRVSGLPFQSFDTAVPIRWVYVDSLVSNSKIFVPTQSLLFSYPKRTVGEPCINPTMSTGTASHFTVIQAMRNALLELIQIDTAMGHWYSETKALKIKLDNRTLPLNRFINKYSNKHAAQPTFYQLQSPDFPGFYIACIFKQSNFPKFAIGLGADTSLLTALYKAYIEASASFNFANINLVNEKLGINQPVTDPKRFFNLDDNVIFYAKGGNNQLICKKFPDSKAINASKLPPDMKGNAKDHVKCLIESFRSTNKELVYVDLTGSEAKALGLVVSRVWSPDTLSLSLPSLPPKRHRRFKMYKCITHEHPHPYP